MSESKKIVYIAGPMTGIKHYNKPLFNEAENNLVSEGFIVLNPADLPLGLSKSQYMDICLSMIRACTHIYMLEGWSDSFGARAERAYALSIDIDVMGSVV